MGPWVGEKHTDFQQLALLLPPTAEKGQEKLCLEKHQAWQTLPKNPPCSRGPARLQWDLLDWDNWRIGFSLGHSGSVPAPHGGSVGRNSALYGREINWPCEVTEKRDEGSGRCIQQGLSCVLSMQGEQREMQREEMGCERELITPNSSQGFSTKGNCQRSSQELLSPLVGRSGSALADLVSLAASSECS